MRQGLSATENKNYQRGTNCYANAQKYIGQQAALVAYLRGTAEMLNGDYNSALTSFHSMFRFANDYSIGMMASNGRLICEYYLCVLAENGPDSATKWLRTVTNICRNGGGTSEVLQYVSVFTTASRNEEAFDKANLLTELDRF